MVLKYSEMATPIGSHPTTRRNCATWRRGSTRLPSPSLAQLGEPRKRQQRVHQNREHLAPTLRLVQANDSGPTATNAELKECVRSEFCLADEVARCNMKAVTGASGESHQIMNTGLRLDLSEERMESMITGLVAVCENLPEEDECTISPTPSSTTCGRGFEDAGPMIESISPFYWYTEPPPPRRPRIVG